MIEKPFIDDQKDSDTQLSNISFSFLRVGTLLKQMLKVSRFVADNLFTSILNKTVAENSLTDWKNLFCYSRKCFLNPNRSEKKSKSLATIINRHINAFSEKPFP